MALLYRFLCPHCFKEKLLPMNSTGRYSLMSGTYQAMVDLKMHDFYAMRFEYSIFDDDNPDEHADAIVSNFIKYGRNEYFTEEQAKEWGISEIMPRYAVWSNTPKHWKCPACGHRMFRISKEPFCVD